MILFVCSLIHLVKPLAKRDTPVVRAGFLLLLKNLSIPQYQGGLIGDMKPRMYGDVPKPEAWIPVEAMKNTL